MKKNKLNLLKLTLVLSCFVSFQSVHSQIFTDSNLPIVIIETENNDVIPDDPRIFGTMKIIKRPDGSRNFVSDANTDEFINYSGTISIETRGSSSQTLPKKPYGFTTLKEDRIENDNVELLGMAKENDWILNAFAFDDSMMRDFISYSIAREMGEYATNLEYCEVIVNGDYKGLYALSEKIKQDGDRVNIVKLSNNDNALPKVTGGYIIKSDKLSSGESFAWVSNGIGYIHEKPKPENVTAQQTAYIESVIRDLDQNASNSSITDGYPSVIDVTSFVNYMLMSEIASNVDSYEFSTFYHKDRNGKLRAGPVWDYNLTFGNDLFQYGLDRSHTDVWQFSNGDNEGAGFWKDLFNNPEFKCYLSRQFNELIQPEKPLNYNYITSLIDSTVLLISEAVLRENQRWDTIIDFSTEITIMKNWIQERLTWMSDNIGSFSNCDSIETPPLVISKINYNPKETTAFPESDDLEFIEIKNNGNTRVDLTGVFFSKLGLSYQFPNNATIEAGESIFLAGDSATFQAKYGLIPYDTFTRNLSNKKQNLVLSDAFGNIIDQVEYLDKAPWPEQADGDGFYLELIDVNSDNAIASNWKATSEEVLTINDFDRNTTALTVYPNPTKGKLNLNSSQIIENITIINPLGQVIKKIQTHYKSGNISINDLNVGVYFLNLELANGDIVSRKILKN